MPASTCSTPVAPSNACVESGSDLATANLVIGAGSTVLARSGEEIVDLLRGGQGVFNIVPLAGVVNEIDAAIFGVRGIPCRGDARLHQVLRNKAPQHTVIRVR